MSFLICSFTFLSFPAPASLPLLVKHFSFTTDARTLESFNRCINIPVSSLVMALAPRSKGQLLRTSASVFRLVQSFTSSSDIFSFVSYFSSIHAPPSGLDMVRIGRFPFLTSLLPTNCSQLAWLLPPWRWLLSRQRHRWQLGTHTTRSPSFLKF